MTISPGMAVELELCHVLVFADRIIGGSCSVGVEDNAIDLWIAGFCTIGTSGSIKPSEVRKPRTQGKGSWRGAM